MANYKEHSGEGVSWTRAKQVIINNPYNDTNKNIVFVEENIVTIGENVFKGDAGILTGKFNPDGIVALIDPATGEATGNVISQSLIYQALFSFYLQLANARDTVGVPSILDIRDTGPNT
jgi:hypothetical protein